MDENLEVIQPLHNRGISRHYAVFLIERVEVLKGPSTLLNGSAPQEIAGSAINLVPKRASKVPLARLTTTYMGDGNLGAHWDMGRRFGPDNAVGIRVNWAYRDSAPPTTRLSARATWLSTSTTEPNACA